MNSVAVVIPTRNRPLFMRRQLDWYQHLGLPVHVYIGSSSDSDVERHWMRGADCGGFGGTNVQITYSHLPEANELEAAYETALIVKEPFTAFCGDDDLLELSVVAAMAARLADTWTAVGFSRTVIFKCWDDTPYGELEAARLTTDEIFKVYRTPLFVNALAAAKDAPTPSLRGARFKAHVDRFGQMEWRGRIHLWRQEHLGRVTSEPPGWRIRAGRQMRWAVELNQWCHSFNPDHVNLPRLRRYHEDWGFPRFERFIRQRTA